MTMAAPAVTEAVGWARRGLGVVRSPFTTSCAAKELQEGPPELLKLCFSWFPLHDSSGNCTQVSCWYKAHAAHRDGHRETRALHSGI